MVDALICLYKAYEEETPDFTRHGLGNLNDAISCTVTKAAMKYELKMEYPVTGKRFGDLQRRRVIYTEPDMVDEAQPFIIDRISKAVKGKVTVYASHKSYALSGIPVNRFTATSAQDFASKVKSYVLSAIPCSFNFTTNVQPSAEDRPLEIEKPVSIRSLLGGGEDTWQGAFGGELVFDGDDVKLLQAAGQDRGVKIRYGVDLIDADMEDNISEMYTGIVPYYSDEEHYATGVYHAAADFGDYIRALPADVTQFVSVTDSDTQQSIEQKVNAVADQWMKDNNIGKPEVSLRVSYAQLDPNRIVQLYDTVTVRIERLGIDVKAKISQTVWDVMRRRYESVDVGDVRSSLSDEVFDAGRLRKGLLPVERIRNKSIGGSKIGGGAVGTKELKDSAVGTKHLQNSAVINSKVEPGTLDASSMSSGVKDSLAGGTQAANVFSGVSTAAYVRATYSTFGQMTFNGRDCRWSYLAYPDGVSRWTIVADN